mmetsp:Transcript_12615/g.44167  ORF Transcript_12615/g.44167 Transcript_12615/m.44167 type:complete len:215 (-) Transcript_12615:696-1340(-)
MRRRMPWFAPTRAAASRLSRGRASATRSSQRASLRAPRRAACASVLRVWPGRHRSRISAVATPTMTFSTRGRTTVAVATAPVASLTTRFCPLWPPKLRGASRQRASRPCPRPSSAATRTGWTSWLPSRSSSPQSTASASTRCAPPGATRPTRPSSGREPTRTASARAAWKSETAPGRSQSASRASRLRTASLARWRPPSAACRRTSAASSSSDR